MTTLISLEWYSLWNKHQCFRNNLWKCPLTFKVYSILFEQNKYLYTCQLQCNFVKAIWVCGFLMTIRLNRLKKTSNTNCWISCFLRQLWLYKSLQFIELDLTLKLLYYSRPCKLYIYVQWKKDRNPAQEIITLIWLWLNTYLPKAALKHIQYEFLDDNYFHYFTVSFHLV